MKSDPPRTLIALRLRPAAIARADAIATAMHWTRSEALRTLLTLGLRAWDQGER